MSFILISIYMCVYIIFLYLDIDVYIFDFKYICKVIIVYKLWNVSNIIVSCFMSVFIFINMFM